MDSDNLTGKPWTDDEIEATLSAYFEMLAREQRGEEYVKTQFRERLAPALRGRSKKAIELKFCNISAVLEEYGHPWIAGYRPARHYQRRLRQAVEARTRG